MTSPDIDPRLINVVGNYLQSHTLPEQYVNMLHDRFIPGLSNTD